MRLMSYGLTKDQYRAGTKDVSRRDGWEFLKPDNHFMGVNKVMGFKPGEHPVHFHESVAVSVIREPLEDIVKRPFRKIVDPERWKWYQKLCPFYVRSCDACYHKGNLGGNPDENISVRSI